MSLLVVEKLSLSYGARVILDNVSLQISARDRIGLVGKNGSGKTSLLRLLTGETRPQDGEVRLSRNVRLGYLPQDVMDAPHGTILSSVLDSVPGIDELRSKIKRAQKKLDQAQSREDQEKAGQILAQLAEERGRMETMHPAHQAEKILTGLGFSPADFNRPLSELSGGWRTRAALASLLFQKPDILLMDEPTNHLDVESVRWLSGFLDAWDGAMILVCHDRTFLNGHVSRVISFETEGLRQYKGNYETYVAQRAEEEVVLDRQAKNQEQKVKEAMRFVEKFRSKATKARQAQSKLKLLEKMEIIDQRPREKTVKFHFPSVQKSGRNVISTENLSKAFGDNLLYKDLNLTVQRGERVAIVGKNGTGKTTLLRILSGELQADTGKAGLGHNVELSYYAQHQAQQLDMKRTVVEEVWASAPNATQTFIRGVCGAFLFSGDEVEKPIRVLSGGEKARVALARLLVNPGNCLLMDEPTNHLDIISSEKLIEALEGYEGTLVFVSHNQSFVNRLATTLWDIQDRSVATFPGNLEQYFVHLDGLEQARQAREKGEEKPAASETRPTGQQVSRKEQKRLDAMKRQELYKKTAHIKKRIEKAEKRINHLEEQEALISSELSDPDVFSDSKKSKELLDRYQKVKTELDKLMAQWETDSAQLEEALESQD